MFKNILQFDSEESPSNFINETRIRSWNQPVHANDG